MLQGGQQVAHGLGVAAVPPAGLVHGRSRDLQGGAAQDLGTVFSFADLTMGLLGVVNLIGLAWMSKLALRLLRDYDDQLAAGAVPRFNPDDYADLGIDRRAWEELPPK